MADQHAFRTIAFPAISTGAYGFPIERATRIAIQEVKTFLERNTSIEKVLFVGFTKRDCECYRKVFGEIFGSSRRD